MDKNRIELFDLLRTIAVFTVVLVHFNGVPLRGSLADSAVDLFFVLSAILVGRPLLTAYVKGHKANLTEFFVKRVTKIIPSYYFFIFFGLIIALVYVKPISPENVITLNELPEYLLFYRNLAGPPPRLIFEHVWSLCVEEQFYVILPFAFFIAQKQFKTDIKKLTISLLGIAIAGISFKIQALFTNIAEWPTYTHNRIDAFAWGLLTLIFLSSNIEEQWARYKKLQLCLFVLGSSVLSFFLMFDFSEIDPHNLILRSVSPICWSFIIIGAYHQKIAFANVFKKISLYSYNLYLWHFLYIIPVEHHFGTGLKGFAVYIILSCISAIFSTHVIERRFLKYRIPLMQYLQPVTYNANSHLNSSTEANLTKEYPKATS
ncbi:acyltransferase [uncultured Pontibacter sp.]|uniref:acyltransferase family protein n=1 Tax=uncultured Pontibacter sp. TaxID=453356 RepID=UPI00262A06C0|nr:acyltransferase [uncultured Pontibacter sp.]